jgi:hypothetical protein
MTYRSHPYEQVSKVFLAQGDYEASAYVLIEKLRIERRVRFSRRPWKRIGLLLLDKLFGYAIFWWPALRTFLIFWILGWLTVDFANYGHLRWLPIGSRDTAIAWSPKLARPVLVVDTEPVSTIALEKDSPNETQARALASPLPNRGFVTEIQCGEQIESALYALDVFVPLLDLKQESRCEISSADYAWLWRMAKSLYAILGWVITSALILTIAGVVRKQIEK